MENVNGINSVWAVLHCGVAPGGPCNEFNGIGAEPGLPRRDLPVRLPHLPLRVGPQRQPEQLRWYVDGQLYHTVTQNQVGAPPGPT